MEETLDTTQATERPKNWLVESILVTVLCCLPFGVAGIVFASQVNSKYDTGDYAGAEKASKQAKTWTLVGAISGFVFLLIYLAVIGLGVAAGEF